MSVNSAQQLLKQVADHGRRWGKHASLKDFSSIDVMAAIIAIAEAGLLGADALVSRDELTKAKRQLTAANARLAKYEKKETAVSIAGAETTDESLLAQ